MAAGCTVGLFFNHTSVCFYNLEPFLWAEQKAPRQRHAGRYILSLDDNQYFVSLLKVEYVCVPSFVNTLDFSGFGP